MSLACDVLTLQFTAIGGALALLHEAVEVVVEEAVGPQNLINVNAVVTGRVLVPLGGTHGHNTEEQRNHGNVPHRSGIGGGLNYFIESTACALLATELRLWLCEMLSRLLYDEQTSDTCETRGYWTQSSRE